MPTLPAGRGLILGLSTFDARLRSEGTTCDLTDLRFVDAFGLVGAACAILGALEAQRRPSVELPVREPVRRHLAGMGFVRFLAQLGYDVSDAEGPLNPHQNVVVPLSLISDHSDTERLSNLLWAQVRNHVDAQVLATLSEGLWEMVGNALEHSHADGALLMGQVYRGGEPPDHDDRVQVVIGDVGRGIRASFTDSDKYAPKTDREAIETALEYLVSSVPDPGRGQGLTTTAEEVGQLMGRLVIRSGNASVTCRLTSNNAREVPYLPGTIVAIDLPLYPAVS
jgi:hypothetical protein